MFLNFREVTLVDLKTLSSVFSTRVAPLEKKIRQNLRLVGAIKGHLSSETIKNLSFLKNLWSIDEVVSDFCPAVWPEQCCL